MSMYTPTTEKVRLRYTAMRSQATGDPVPEIEAEFDRWLQATITEASKPLERMVQELENENARLQTELAETEGRIVALQEEAWDRGYRPYRAGGDAK